MIKTASEIVNAVMKKVAFSITEEGHQFDADEASAKKQYFLEMARKLQDVGALGHADPETGESQLPNLGKALRFDIPGGNPTDQARHQDYVQKQHAEGSNAWNPWGGTSTPIKEEQGGTPGFFGMLGKVGPSEVPTE